MSDSASFALLSLQVKGLCFSAAGVPLIDSLDLSISPARVTIIMGANGAGKSLLLRLLHGLLAPTAGTVFWNGRPASQSTSRNQAMVFQRPVLLRRSVAANLDFALALRPLGTKQERRLRRDELLALVDLTDQAEQPARLLSGGEQQRLALARALATNPAVLFLDEPTASLDPASVLIIERIVMAVYRAGCAVFFVTHDIGQAKRLADDVVFLHHGRLAEFAPAERFFRDPVSEPAQAYLSGRILL